MKKSLWVLTAISSVVGGVIVAIAALILPHTATWLYEWAGGRDSARVTLMALGIAFAIIPYCLARAVSEIEG